MKTLLNLFDSFYQRQDSAVFIYLTGVRRLVFSYRDLIFHARKMSRWLESQGIEKGDRVMLWAPNSPWWAVAFWGIILRGAVVVPVDFASGRDRAEKIAQWSGCKLLIQSLYKLDKLEPDRAFYLEDLQYQIAKYPESLAIPEIDPADIAELVYTSGTTGDPKGVILTHKNLMANLRQINEHLPVIAPEYRFLSLLPMSHMLEQMAGFLTPLYGGGSIIYLRSIKPSAILSAFATENITVAIAVPRLLQVLKTGIERELRTKHLIKLFEFLLRRAPRWPHFIKQLMFYPIHAKFGSKFEFFVSGGSKLELGVALFWKNLGFRVIEGYGITECSPVLATNLYDEQRLGSIGKSLPHLQLRLDNEEIMAQGDNVFSGYWDNQAATAAAFTQDGWFKTGDIATMDADGWFYMKGRKKDVIVTGAGINVYPEDLERILTATPGVREACIVGKTTPEGEQVHAVLVLDSLVDPQGVITAVNQQLDMQQQIAGFSLWPDPELPKTSTLKVQKFKVLETINRPEISPGTGSSDKLISLVSQIVHKPVNEISEQSILVQDLGLTSVARLELVNYIEQEFRLDLEDTLIGQQTTVATLRELIRKRENFRTNGHFHFWPNTWWGRMLRRACDLLLNGPIFFSTVKLTLSGYENLALIKGPVIFIANHVSYYDQPAIMFALPRHLRYHTASAAWAEFFFKATSTFQLIWKRFTYYYGLIGLNLFPLPQESGFRKSLNFMGKLIDHKVNILFFPEGGHTRNNEMLPFMDGLGLVVTELQVPVVPIRVKGMEKVFPHGAAMPKKGIVEVVFGQPLHFTGESTSQILDMSRKAIELL